MPGTQGKKITQEQIVKIKRLLAETELTTSQIALRMGSSTSTVIAINRRAGIRLYNGKRSCWEKGLPCNPQVAPARVQSISSSSS